MSETETQDALVAINRAYEVITALCNGKMGWRMSVPAEPDSDPDLVISHALHLAEDRILKLERIADQAWTCTEMAKHNDTPVDEAFGKLTRMCAEYQPRYADVMLIALSDLAAPSALAALGDALSETEGPE